MARIRTLNFLPEIFHTPTNQQFLSATLDQIVNNSDQRRIQGYVGSKFGYGINANDRYITEPTKIRTDYQLTPSIIFTKKDEMAAKDFITYPGLIDALKLQGGVTENNSKLFESQIYSWDPFIDLDKIINFNQYYWAPEGLPAVEIATNVVYNNTDYVVKSESNNYNIRSLETATGEENPTLTLLRGGTYRFIVDQDSGFFIQTQPGTSGTSATQPNRSTRLTQDNGVINNGARAGAVIFEVPQVTAQDNLVFTNQVDVDLVSNLNFQDINGKLLQDVENIDGVTDLEGRTILFYNNTTDEKAFTDGFFAESNYDINIGLINEADPDEIFNPSDNFASTTPLTIVVTNTLASTNRLIVDTTNLPQNDIKNVLQVNNVITFPNSVFGGINQYNGALNNVIYYVKEIIDANKFTISQSINGPEVTLTTASGSMNATVNQGLNEEGFYSFVNNYFYIVTYVENIDDPVNPIIRLKPYQLINENTQITALYGTEYIGLDFYKDLTGSIKEVPNITANLNTLYYQDASNPNKVGILRIIENNIGNNLNVETDILGKKNFQITVPNQQVVIFTNGLKVSFSGDVTPISYLEGEYYVQGVGTEKGIELIDLKETVTPEAYTFENPIPYDIFPWDIGAYSGSNSIPINKDYITIARNAINKNGWSRSNRWFHSSVIDATAKYNNNPEILNEYAVEKNKANRPIIEFYPNLKLFNQGTLGKTPVDFIDRRTSDAFSIVNGQVNYYPDVKIFTGYNATIQASPGYSGTDNVNSTDLIVGEIYEIVSVGTTDWIACGAESNTAGISFTASAIGAGTGTAKALSYTYALVPQSSVKTSQSDGSIIAATFTLTQYISDLGNYENPTPLSGILPTNAIISSISDITISSTKYFKLQISWAKNDPIESAYTNRSLIANPFLQDFDNTNYNLFNGARIIFAADTNAEVRDKIYVVNLSPITVGGKPIISLVEASDGAIKDNEQTVITRGYFNTGKTYRFTDENYGAWILAQFKYDTNQEPLFDVFDKIGQSLSNQEIYEGSNFAGSKLFAYAKGTGTDDPVLGFPLAYSSLTNVGDIKFDVAFNSQRFDYVNNLTNLPANEPINLGFVRNYETRSLFERLTGWVPAIAPSVQYQNFEFDFFSENPNRIFQIDVPVNDQKPDSWPVAFVYINNIPVEKSDYIYAVENGKTNFFIDVKSLTNTKVQIQVLSDKVSSSGYYSIPINLNNNPFNTDIKEVNIGDIRRQYTSIFYNNNTIKGEIFGNNNFQDLGDLIYWGDKIIQNSASLVAPGTFNRTENNNLFNALLYNSREYIKFKTLLVDTVNNTDYPQRYTPAVILDDALDQITSSKSQEQSFFWSDMVPSKSPFITNTYTIKNNIETSFYDLSKIYNYTKANYDGVLVYLQRKAGVINNVSQLMKDVDYTISTDSPSLTITKDLLKGDTIIINEYNQTYGSYVPNTPTKLGMYPATKPAVIYDKSYQNFTYFIVGHDGSYNKLYGNYDPVTNTLQDYRDQVLFEFENRVYNNLKLEGLISPVQQFDYIPGFFRSEVNNLTNLNYEQWISMYSLTFLDWIGQNRLNYKTQVFNRSSPWTYNYRDSLNKVNKSLVTQGDWRGLYQYFYDTTTPNTTPWEMLGYANKPNWWEERYGPAPYTSNNQQLWQDLEAGYDYGSPILDSKDLIIGKKYRIITLGTTDWNIVAGTSGVAYNVNDDITIVNQYLGTGTANSIITFAARPGLSEILPVNAAGQLLNPIECLLSNYDGNIFKRDWIIGDNAAVELSYRRSSSYPFDCLRIFALSNPAKFYNLCIDLDDYRYNIEFNQYLVDDRKHLIYDDIKIYGNGTAKTSYLNWIVDYQKQQGIKATQNIEDLLYNLDVRLTYRMAGFSDKTLLKFFVEKSNPSATNTSLLIPDASYQVLLYENQPSDKIIFTSVIIQKTKNGFKVYGNSQKNAYFTTLAPDINSQPLQIIVEGLEVNVYSSSLNEYEYVPYGTEFYNVQDVAQFMLNYGAYTISLGAKYETQLNGIEINWETMVAEFLYWAQIGWVIGATLNCNPAALSLEIDKESHVVQPLTLYKENFVLNQNLFPIQLSNLSIVRDGTNFKVTCLNEGEIVSYGEFNLSNMEHGIVFDNITEFQDIIYNLTTGVRQNRIYTIGSKSAEWNGFLYIAGFIYNQDNIKEWNKNTKYTKGNIVEYKNRYYSATKVIQPAESFQETEWIVTDYNEIQKGLLPNSATRSYESTLYYNSNNANLENEADLLSFSLIGFRPRSYMKAADLTDITQVNVFKNLIKNKGTKNAIDAFKGANLPQGGIQYDLYENWAILSGKFGGSLSENFIEIRLNENKMVGNPGTVSLTTGDFTPGMQQYVPLNKIFNYSQPITNVNVLPTKPYSPNMVYPDAGYVNFNDVKMSSYFYSDLPNAINKQGDVVPIENVYVRDYIWLADYLGSWKVCTPDILINNYNKSSPAPVIINLTTNPNGTATLTFNNAHGLEKFDLIIIINFDTSVNGYYTVSEIINPTQILINFVTTEGLIISGEGTCLKLINQRVSNPTKILNLPLLSSEFTQNTVWVDENDDGAWAVYRKSLNYKRVKELEIEGSTSYGYSVAYNDNFGYLVGDPGDVDNTDDITPGNVYRYTGPLDNLLLLETFNTGERSFGQTIAYNNNTIVISQPTATTDKKVFVYVYNSNNSLTEDLLLTQEIEPPTTVDSWGESLAISNDGNYIFILNNEDALSNNKEIYAYKRQNINLSAEYLTADETYIITSVGTTDFAAISTTTTTTENKVGQIFVATGAGTGTGTVTQISYKFAGIISDIDSTVGDNFGKSIACDYYADTIVVGAPNSDYTSLTTTKSDWGRAVVYNRISQNIEVQSNSVGENAQVFTLFVDPSPDTVTVNLLNTYSNNAMELSSTTDISVNDPIVFLGSGLAATNIITAKTYYVAELIAGNKIKIKTSRSTTDVSTLIEKLSIPEGTATATPQFLHVDVTVNGISVQDNNYALVDTTLYYSTYLNAGDIINISQNTFVKVQTLTSTSTPKTGVAFGTSVDITSFGTEIIVGAPFELEDGNEGGVYRFTDAGGEYGMIIGSEEVNLTTNQSILLNGYMVNLLDGSNAADVAQTINSAKITNVQAASTDQNKLIISLRNMSIAAANHELELTVSSIDTLNELGITIYPNTQLISCPHSETQTQFGSVVKFDESNNSFVASAPTGTRFAATTFDFIDDENQDNDTVFDNNATRWIDTFRNAGAVYMFDYIAKYDETVTEPGAYVYAQSVNSNSLSYGTQPLYGSALAFTDNTVLVGTPYYKPESVDGQVVIFDNTTGQTDWAVYRKSCDIVDINRINNIQLFSAETNNSLLNLDYIDPLAGKIFGAVRQNIDYVCNLDPASYNNISNNTNVIWGDNNVGKLWLDTSNMRFVNYHQNDPVYNATYWGTLFPGSDPAIYTWVVSVDPPTQYTGVGVPKDFNKFSIQTFIDQSGTVTLCYYFWVRFTNVIVPNSGKTLSDTVMESYLLNPLQSGISYFAPLLPNSYAIYNAQQSIKNTDTILHIGYKSTTSESIPHQEFNLVRSNFADDFLPGLPNTQYPHPTYLYDRMLDSMAGVDEEGSTVPNPYLPRAVQSGVLVRPRQSFFYNRYTALKNYIQYANTIMAQYPLVEIRPDATFFYKENKPIFDIVTGLLIVKDLTYNIVTLGNTTWSTIGATLVSAGDFVIGKTYIINTISNTDYTLIGANTNSVGVKFIATGTGNGNGTGTAYEITFTATANGNGDGTASTLTFDEGELYKTSDYVTRIDWWAEGFDNNTKPAFQVQLYSDLLRLENIDINTIARVIKGGNNTRETYIYVIETLDDNTQIERWKRIGLEKGTYEISKEIYDYDLGKYGYGGNFYDTDSFDDFPSNETRWIIRCLNEQIFTNELLIHRNKALILLFEYIVSETNESQNYLPWLNKTSLVDVKHTVRELLPTEKFRTDSDEFLSGYFNEVKPYHVVIKEFLLNYTKLDVYPGTLTDFDLPASYNTTQDEFITPQLVYGPLVQNNNNQFDKTSSEWQNDIYNEWYNNWGLMLSSSYQSPSYTDYLTENEKLEETIYSANYFMTTLQTYLPITSTTAIMKNVSGFPVTGTFRIEEELITYAGIDRARNLLTGLTRGVEGTTKTVHLPNSEVYMELPPIIVIDSGSQYNEFTPKVTAVVDELIYSAPRKPAVLQAVMALDKVINIEVLDPGSGFETKPEIVIEPSIKIVFNSTAVDNNTNTISISGFTLKTGDSIKYIAGFITVDATNIVPSQIYTIQTIGTTNFTLMGAPNNLVGTKFIATRVGTGTGTLKQSVPIDYLVDNQWYYVRLIDNIPNPIVALYASYAEAVQDKNKIPIQVSTTNVENQLWLGARALAVTTAQPVRENIVSIKFDRNSFDSKVTDWAKDRFYGSFFAGDYESQSASSWSLKLQSTQPDINSVLTSSQGFVFPIYNATRESEVIQSTFERSVESFIGSTITLKLNAPLSSTTSGSTIGFYVGMPIKFNGNISITGLQNNTYYYVKTILNETDFTISAEPNGTVISFPINLIPTATVACYTGDVVYGTQITTNYDGIRKVTKSSSTNNAYTIPVTALGTGGTQHMYIGAPVMFTLDLFGGVRQNQVYYVTTVIDSENFTISENSTPSTYSLLSASSTTNEIQLNVVSGLNIGDPIIVNSMSIDGVSVLDFGNIIAGTVYYIYDIDVLNSVIKLTTVKNGTTELSLDDVSEGTGTSALLTSQVDVVQLDNYTNGDMTMNLGLPVSPGQVNGQAFTFYETGAVYGPLEPDLLLNVIQRNIVQSVDTSDILAFSELGAGLTDVYVNMPFTLNKNIGGLIKNDVYYVKSQNTINVSCSSSGSGTIINCTSTSLIYDKMPIVFQPDPNGAEPKVFGTIIQGQTYYVRTIGIAPYTSFRIANYPNGTPINIGNDSGNMLGIGPDYITVSSTLGGSTLTLSSQALNVVLTQHTDFETDTPTFTVQSFLGGYSVQIVNPGSGFTIGNKLIIYGEYIGGTTSKNNLTLEINNVNSIGAITSVVASGTVPTDKAIYYVEIDGSNKFNLYQDAALNEPVDVSAWVYNGIEQTTATATTTGTNYITVSDSTIFEEYDTVKFSGTVFGNIELVTTYFITSIPNSTTIVVSETQGGTAVALDTATGTMTVSKFGSMMLLPEPFYFQASIVKYNNKVYRCLVSNNDQEFIFGKWYEINSGDQELNAIDRAVGYYQPTASMPGLDLPQLFTGLEYPNTTYIGQEFQTNQILPLDIELQDTKFEPKDLNLVTGVYRNTKYIIPTNTSQYSGLSKNLTGIKFNVTKVTNRPAAFTELTFADNTYVMTSTNVATPIMISADAITWQTNGLEDLPGVVDVPAAQLRSVKYMNDTWVAVGDKILTSTDVNQWTTTKSFSVNRQVTMYGVEGVSWLNSGTFIAVGQQILDLTEPELGYSGLVAIADNDGSAWTTYANVSQHGFRSVTSSANLIVAVGANGTIYTSTNAQTWSGVSESIVTGSNAGLNEISVASVQGFNVNDEVKVIIPTNVTANVNVLDPDVSYYISSINSTTKGLVFKTSLLGPVVDIDGSGTPSAAAYVYKITDYNDRNINKVVYANNRFMAVGELGLILTSTNGINWTEQTIDTLKDINGIIYAEGISTWTVVGEENLIANSTDNGVTWIINAQFITPERDYTVSGGPFLSGYGPEELVPGNTQDSLQLTVVTRPGASWPVNQYNHNGYNVVSIELSPSSSTQVTYQFNYNPVTKQYLTQIPAQISVSVINGSTNVSTTLLQNASGYHVHWKSGTITLNNPINFPNDKLRIDVYEVGNGYQIVKSNTKESPYKTNNEASYGTTFDSIPLPCNYVGSESTGSGAVRPGTEPIETIATTTLANSNTITVESVEGMLVNGQISFYGNVLGGLTEDQTYYIKTITTTTDTGTFVNRITISATLVSGKAGPTVTLTTESGSMNCVVQVGNGLYWTDPIVIKKGVRLTSGESFYVYRTKATTNTVITNTLSGLNEGDPIVFDYGITFCPEITPFTTYYVCKFVDSNEFTITTTQGSSTPVTLSNRYGQARFISNDYDIVMSSDNITAEIIFAENIIPSDYIAYSVFGEKQPSDTGYTIPETQIIPLNGNTTYTLTNFVGGVNPTNAIVEINGVRQDIATYTILPESNVITFGAGPPSGQNLTVTSYNNTQEQYFNTLYEVSGQAGATSESFVVESTTRVEEGYDDPLSGGYDDTPYDYLINYLTLANPFSTDTFSVGQTLVFGNPTIGDVQSNRKYYILQILNSTEFTIGSTPGGVEVTLYDDTGSMPTLANSINVAEIIDVDNTINPGIQITITNTYESNNRIQCNTVEGIIVGAYIEFQNVRIPPDQIEVGDIYRIELLGQDTNWNTIAGTTGITYKVGDFVTAVEAGTGDGVALQAYFGDLNTAGAPYTVADIDVATKTIQVYDFEDEIAQLVDYSGTIYGIVGATQSTTITTELPHYFTENEQVRISGTLGSVQLNDKIFYAHVLSPTVFAVYLQQYDPAYNAPNNYPVTEVDTYEGGGYAWRQGLFVVETTTASETSAENDRITVADTKGLIEGTPVYFSKYGVRVGDEVIGGLLYGETYYVKEVAPITNAANLRTNYDYEIAVLGNTDWISVGANAAATFTGSISGTTLTVTSITGFVENGAQVSGTGVTAGTIILEPLSASGTTGTYKVSVSQTVASTTLQTVELGTLFTATGSASSTTNGSAYSLEEFTVSELRDGLVKELTTDELFVNVTQWQQSNVDRLWVTVNGYRVPSSSLKLYPYNEIGILSTVEAGDNVTITSMTPAASPSQERYINFVNSNGVGSVYRANAQTVTWLTSQLDEYETKIIVNDINDVVDVVDQTSIVPAVSVVDNRFNIGLNAQKADILKVLVYNTTKNLLLSKGQYKIITLNMVPTLSINNRPLSIEEDDILNITIFEGSSVLINAEIIRLNDVDVESNTLFIQQRGVNGTGVPHNHPVYSTVQGLQRNNRMLDTQYTETWNPIPGEYSLAGDPLQIANTIPANFLKTDTT